MLGGIKQKVLSTFSKVVQSRVKLWSHSAECEILYRQALIGRAREPFCKRKGFQELITSPDYPRKVPSGKFSAVETPVL